MRQTLSATPLLREIRTDRALVLALALLYGLVAGLIGFGHAAMASPGSKGPELCLTLDDGSSPDAGSSAGCDACLLTHAPGLVVTLAPLPEPAFGAATNVSPSRVAASPVLHARAPPARGPPTSRTSIKPA